MNTDLERYKKGDINGFLDPTSVLPKEKKKSKLKKLKEWLVAKLTFKYSNNKKESFGKFDCDFSVAYGETDSLLSEFSHINASLPTEEKLTRTKESLNRLRESENSGFSTEQDDEDTDDMISRAFTMRECR